MRVRQMLRIVRQRLSRLVSPLWRRLTDAVPGLVRDLHLYGGLALAGYGLWLWWPPAGFIGPGLAVFGIGVFGVPRWRSGD